MRSWLEMGTLNLSSGIYLKCHPDHISIGISLGRWEEVCTADYFILARVLPYAPTVVSRH